MRSSISVFCCEGALLDLESFPRYKAKAQKAAKAITGREVTDVSLVCCNEGAWVIYVGLGSSNVAPRHRPAPTGRTA